MKKHAFFLSIFLAVPAAAQITVQRSTVPLSVDVAQEVANLQSEDASLRVIAAHRLGASRDKKARAELRKGLEAEKDPYVKSKMINALAADQDEDVSEGIRQALKKDPSPDVRHSAVNALARSGSGKNRALLMQLFLDDKEELDTRLRAGHSLGRLKPSDEVYQCLLKGMDSPVPQIRSQAVTSLSRGSFDRQVVAAELMKRETLEKDGAVKKAIQQGLKSLASDSPAPRRPPTPLKR